HIYPAPGAAGILTVYYYRQAVAATADNQPLDLMSGWEDIVYDYAVYKAKRANQDQTWQDAFQLYEGNLMTMVNRTRSMTDLGSQITSQAPAFPVYQFAGDEF